MITPYLDTFAGQSKRFTIPGYLNLLRQVAFARCANEVNEFLEDWDHNGPSSVVLVEWLIPNVELLDDEVMNELVLLCQRAGYTDVSYAGEGEGIWRLTIKP